MVIVNPIVRTGVCAVVSFCSGVMFLALPLVMYKMKGFVRNSIKQSRPHNSLLLVRLLDDPPDVPMKMRAPVDIKVIPIKRNEWVKGEYYVEEHDATTLHHDFSIIVGGRVYRMARSASVSAMDKHGWLGIFPSLQERTGWIMQPEHYLSEVPNPPIIYEGYGAGTTKVIAHGHCYVMISDQENMHIMFENIDGVYTFVETGNNQVLMMRKHHEGTWIGKHQLATSDNVQPYIDNDDYSFFIKKDGAAVEWRIVETRTGDKHLHIHSYRPNARLMKEVGIHTQIDHTYRLHLADKSLDSNIPLAAGRGELWCSGMDGRMRVARIMNSSHYKARSYPYRPYLYVHDITEFNNNDTSSYSYADKIKLMEELHGKDKRFKIPDHASTTKGKTNLWLRAKQENSVDGVVAWDMHQKDAKGIKLKFTQEREHWHSATIVDTTPQEGIHSDKYSYPIVENEAGIRFKVSGKGLTNKCKADLHSNPNSYIGQEVRYSADTHFHETTGKPFQPTIKEWNAV